MKNKNILKKTPGIFLKLLATFILVCYLIFFLGEILHPYSGTTFGLIMVYIMFLFFLLGYSFLWKNGKVSGIIFIMWYGFLLVLALWVWVNAGMVLGLGIPIPILGALLLVKAYAKNIKKSTSQKY